MLSAFNTIAEIGVKFIPGVGEAETGLEAAVQGAKTFAQNAMKADKFFGNVSLVSRLPLHLPARWKAAKENS
jgi:hypothetical protein